MRKCWIVKFLRAFLSTSQIQQESWNFKYVISKASCITPRITHKMDPRGESKKNYQHFRGLLNKKEIQTTILFILWTTRYEFWKRRRGRGRERNFFKFLFWVYLQKQQQQQHQEQKSTKTKAIAKTKNAKVTYKNIINEQKQ